MRVSKCSESWHCEAWLPRGRAQSHTPSRDIFSNGTSLASGSGHPGMNIILPCQTRMLRLTLMVHERTIVCCLYMVLHVSVISKSSRWSATQCFFERSGSGTRSRCSQCMHVTFLLTIHDLAQVVCICDEGSCLYICRWCLANLSSYAAVEREPRVCAIRITQ